MRHINPLLNPDIMVGEEEEEEEEEEENQSEEEDQLQIHGHLQLPQHRFQKQQFNGRLDRDEINTHQTRPLKKRPFFLSSPSTSSKQSIDYSRFGKTIMEYTHHLQPPWRSGLKNAGGKIIEVQGGHVVRSSGTKDRHSKICTAKGARDRRVRLSAHTAIQFYDVQDRLGYDRPSKALDWLIKKAKSAIDELAELPPWNPTATTRDEIVGSKRSIVPSNDCNFLPPSFESDAIADTIKSFFPMAGSATTSSSTPFQNYPPDLLSRTSSQNQDLRLSLQSFQNPNLPHQQPPISNSPTTSMEQALFSISALQPFDASVNSSEKQQPSPEMGRFQRMITWDSGIETENRGFVFHSQNQLFSQREPLQSSNSPSVRVLTEPNSAAGDLHHTPLVNPSSISGFASGEFSGFNFHIPARIQGEEQSSFSNESSSDSRH